MTADLLENQAAIVQVPHVFTRPTLDWECMTSVAILRAFPKQVDKVSYWRLIRIYGSQDLSISTFWNRKRKLTWIFLSTASVVAG